MAKKKRSKKSGKAEKEDRVERAMDAITKRFGDASISRGRKLSESAWREVIRTGSVDLDVKLKGGWFRGRTYELFGPESVGKSTLAFTGIAEAQKKGATTAYVDLERGLDFDYLEAIGIDLDRLLISQPENAQMALETVRELVRAGIDMIVVDTVAALSPRQEMEGEIGDQHVGIVARLMSQTMRMLTSEVKANNNVLIFVNQMRENIGVKYGPTETTPGGKALKYYASVRAYVRHKAAIKTNVDGREMIVGRWVAVRIEKSRTSLPFVEAEFPIIFGRGIQKSREILTYAQSIDVVERNGAWYSFGDVKLGQGTDNSCLFLEENEEVMADIESAVAEKMGWT